MENVLEAIRAALAAEATPEKRTAGANACRAILTALEPSVEQATGAAGGDPPIPPPIASAVALLRGVPAEQRLDVAITWLRNLLPAGTSVPAVQPLKFQMIQVEPFMPKRTP